MHVRFEITRFVDMYNLIHTMNYQFSRPRMLQMKFEPNWASGFDLSLKVLFENIEILIDNRQR